MENSEKIHIFLSREAASIYSRINGVKAQGLQDVMVEIASNFRISLLSGYEIIKILLEAGAQIEDVNTIIKTKNFLKVLDRENEIHKIPSDKHYQKRIENISSVIVSYYSKITDLKKSEIDDIPDFINLFGIKFQKENYIVHIPEFYKKFRKLFHGAQFQESQKRNQRIIKKKFPDYWAEARWIASSIIEDSGLIGIVAPDDISLIDISRELSLFGVKNVIISTIPYFEGSSIPLLLLKSFLSAIQENYSFESMMRLLTNPLLKIKEEKISKIRMMCYENNVTDSWENWVIILNDLPDIRDLFILISRSIGNKRGMIEALNQINNKFINNRKISELLDLTALIDDKYFSDLEALLYYINVISSLVKTNNISEGNVIIGKPEDMIGLEFDKVYISRLDSTSSKKSFPEESRDLLRGITGLDLYEDFLSSSYLSILNNSKEAVLSYSSLDEALNYTESVLFYDSIKSEEETMTRENIFKLVRTDSPISIQKNTFIMDENLVNKILEYPVSPTSFEPYLDCPFKYFLQTVLNLQEIEEPNEFIDARTSGSLTHNILQENYDLNISPREFSERAEKFIQSKIGKSIFPSRKRALEFYRRKYISNGKLTRFFIMDSHAAMEKGRKIIAAELKFGNKGETLYEVDGRKIKIKGIIDRIDEAPDGLSIIDYKSSLTEYPKGSLCNERKVQLFFYKLGAEQIYNKKVTSAAYVSFRDIADGYQTRGLYDGIQNEEMEIRNCENVINRALSSLFKGNFDPFIKENDDIVKCERTFYCPFLNVCRGQERRW